MSGWEVIMVIGAGSGAFTAIAIYLIAKKIDEGVRVLWLIHQQLVEIQKRDN